MPDPLLEWIKVLGPIIISWPTTVILVSLLFRRPLIALIERFTDSPESKAEIGPQGFKLEMGKLVPPSKFKTAVKEAEAQVFDLSKDIGLIRDQGQESTSTGFAVAYAMQAAIKAASGKQVVLSARGIYVTAKKSDGMAGEGTTLEAVLQAVQKTGAYLEADWPYASKSRAKAGTKPAYRISGFQELQGIEGVLSAIRGGKTVVAGLNATEDLFAPDKDGRIVIHLPLKSMGGHPVCIVGYKEKTAEFKFANSWGTAWADGGFGWMRDSDLGQILLNAYTLDV